MLDSVKTLTSFNVLAEDGECGQVSDMLFDDLDWRLRYLVVDTGTWLSGRKVLLPPTVLSYPDTGAEVFPVSLSRNDIKNSRPLSADEPVSQREGRRFLLHGSHEVHQHVVRSAMDNSAAWVVPVGAIPEAGTATTETPPEGTEDIHLRSSKEVIGYGVTAEDGDQHADIGTIDDFIVDEESWVIRYAVVDTGKIFPGTKKILALPWVSNVNYDRRQVTVNVPLEAVKNSPEFDPAAVMDRSYEEAIYQYYQRRRYWE